MADDEPVSPPEVLETKKSSPVQAFVRAALTLLLIYLIFGVLIPSFASYSDIWDAIKQVSAGAFVLLLALTVLVEAMKSMAPVVLIDKLGLGRSFLAQETSAMISNTVPGPSGTAMRYVTYRRYGLTTEEFGRSTIVNSLWNNAIILLMPTLAVALLATQDKVPTNVWWLTLIGLGITLVGVVLVGLILHSENFARRFGELLGRAINWARGVVKRPKPQDYATVIVNFRFDIRDSVRRHWLGLSGVIVAKEFTTFLILLVSLRAVGAGRVSLTAIEIFAVYAVVKVLTMIEITPGGVGVTEALYISALSWAANGQDNSAITGGVFVFRMFTYLGPVLLGLILWPVLNRMLRPTGQQDATAPAVPAARDTTEPRT
ncbi:MAG TPA: YbhN family protein [Streptosporangiaceae bacterium]|jgi:uncharacterized protein (TIRG00374 family)